MKVVEKINKHFMFNDVFPNFVPFKRKC